MSKLTIVGRSLGIPAVTAITISLYCGNVSTQCWCYLMLRFHIRLWVNAAPTRQSTWHSRRLSRTGNRQDAPLHHCVGGNTITAFRVKMFKIVQVYVQYACSICVNKWSVKYSALEANRFTVRGGPMAQEFRREKLSKCSLLPAFIYLALSTVPPPHDWKARQRYSISQLYAEVAFQKKSGN